MASGDNSEPPPQRLRSTDHALFSCGICKEASCRTSVDEKLCASSGRPLVYLDLSRTSAEDWPNILFRHTNAKSLRLRSRSQQRVPKEIVGLTKLEILSLESVSLELLPQLVETLSALKKLTIKDCQITEQLRSLTELRCLVELSLDKLLFLRELTPSFGNLSELQDLSITRCGLESLPEQFGVLRKLEKLQFRSNLSLSRLCNSFGDLSGLKDLTITECSLSELPGSFVKLCNLTTLTLENMISLSDLGPSFGALTELRVLRIKYCGLSRLPDSFKGLANLRTLELEDIIDLSDLGQSFGDLTELRVLTIKNCGLSRLPDSFTRLGNLESLILSNNRLKDYPECTIDLQSLRLLDLSNDHCNLERGNCITSIPNEFRKTCLKELKLLGNPVNIPSEFIWKQGVDAIKGYFSNLCFQDTMQFCPDTINMLGESLAGKTSIALSLANGKPMTAKKDGRTQVLNKYKLTIPSGSSVYINDFGGHAIYQSVIPIFLPFTGLSILAYNLKKSRKEQEYEVEKWLLTAVARSSQIRMVVVGTHSDSFSSPVLLKLKEQMSNFVKEVFENLKWNVKNAIDMHSSINDERLEKLTALRLKIHEAQHVCTTVSCKKSSKDFSAFHELVLNSLQQCEIMPSRWHLVMQDIVNEQRSGFPYIDMSTVQMMYAKHIDDEYENLPIILRYLANSSKILWFEKNERLRDFVFYSPQQMVDICRKILYHKRSSLKLRRLFNDDLVAYAQGKLTERLLKKLIPEFQENECNVFIDFLQQFNLMSELFSTEKTRIGERGFVIAGNLSKEEPSELQEAKQVFHLKDQFKGLNCSGGDSQFSKICVPSVNLAFDGSIIPLSFFETSQLMISSELNAKLKNNVVLKHWRNGLLIKYGSVYLVMRRLKKKEQINLTAGSEEQKSSPWRILLDVLKLLQKNIDDSWPGVSPKWKILCPTCNKLHARGDKRIKGEATLVFEECAIDWIEEEGSTSFSFERCTHLVRRTLSNTALEAQTESLRVRQLTENNPKPYDMDSRKHGLCLIINNVSAVPDCRKGANKDAALLKRTFTKLGYRVQCKKFLTANEIQKLMEKTAREYPQKFDSFVCCILAREQCSGILGSDKGLVTIEELTKYFYPQFCPSLKGKPKLFFILACRSIEHPGIPVSAKDIARLPPIPNNMDFLVRYYVGSGYLSYRKKNGSFFVEKFEDVLTNNFKRYDLSAMLTTFDDQLDNYELEGRYTPVPMPQYSLQRKVFFCQQQRSGGTTEHALSGNQAGKRKC